MSIGGNVAVKAGGDIHDLAVSTPTTAYLDASNALHITGGGDLSVVAGGSIYSGDFYVGQGAGSIRAGGAITSDFTFESTVLAYPVQTLLSLSSTARSMSRRASRPILAAFTTRPICGHRVRYWGCQWGFLELLSRRRWGITPRAITLRGGQPGALCHQHEPQ